MWCEDAAGPYPAIPQPGHRWQPAGAPECYPHEYSRGGTAKLLTLFHPATGQGRVKGVTHSTNAVLHPWLQAELAAIVATRPPLEPRPERSDAAANQAVWACWQEGLSVRFTLLEELPPLRLRLILDNVTGHKTAAFVCWLRAHGMMPLYTPLGGSWLNGAESVQRILVSRALSGQQPENPEQLIAWLEAVAHGWNACPTPLRGVANARPATSGHGNGAIIWVVLGPWCSNRFGIR